MKQTRPPWPVRWWLSKSSCHLLLSLRNGTYDMKDRVSRCDTLKLGERRRGIDAKMVTGRHRGPLEVGPEQGRPLMDRHLLKERLLTRPMTNDGMALGGAYVPYPVRPLA